MFNVMGCIAPETWWAARRARLRVIVLIIVLGYITWLVEQQHYSLTEAAGGILLITAVAGVMIDRVVDGSKAVLGQLAALVQPQPPYPPCGRH
jgi:lipoprotein signal peptidase